jgi:subtilisin family serine protease
MDPDRVLAFFSNEGPEMDVIAPGVGVVSFDVTNGNTRAGFGYCSGTSQAAPQIAAAAAMMLAVNPSLTPEQVKRIIRETSEPAWDPEYREVDLTDSIRASFRLLRRW